MTHYTRYEGKIENKPYLFGNRVSSFLGKKYGKPVSQEKPSGSTLIGYFKNNEVNILTTECGDGYVFIQVRGNVDHMRNFGKTLKDKFGEKIKNFEM